MNLENLLKAQQLFACTEISLGSKNQLLGCCKQSWEDAQSWLEYLPWISSCSPWNKQHSGMQTASCFRRDSADSQNVSKAKLDRTELWIFLWNSGVLQLICLIIRRKKPQPQSNKKKQQPNTAANLRGIKELCLCSLLFETKHWKKNVQFQ